MGVKGLWQLISHTGRSVKLESLSNKRLAVDASIWLYQFIKAMRDPSGKLIHGAHIIGFFKRICKLLYYGIKPIFVFDGKPPELKKQTMAARKTKRLHSEGNLKQTASKILSAKLKLAAIDSVSGNSSMKRTAPENDQSKKKLKVDEFQLDDLDNGINLNDPRFLSENELLDFINENSQKIDLSLANIESSSFKSLPPEVQHSIILDLKLQSRQPSKERLDSIVSNSRDALDFSKNQIEYLVKRNYLTEKSMEVAKTSRHDRSEKVPQKLAKRVAGERNRQFALIKDDQSGGYTMRVKFNQPVDLENDAEKSDEVQVSSDSEGSDVFEFVSKIKSLESDHDLKTRSFNSGSIQMNQSDNTGFFFVEPEEMMHDVDSFSQNYSSIAPRQPQISKVISSPTESQSIKEEFLDYWILSAPSSLHTHLPNYIDIFERAILSDDVSEINNIINTRIQKNLDEETVSFLSEFLHNLSNTKSKEPDLSHEKNADVQDIEKKKSNISGTAGSTKESFLEFEGEQSSSNIEGPLTKVGEDFESPNEEAFIVHPVLPPSSDISHGFEYRQDTQRILTPPKKISNESQVEETLGSDKMKDSTYQLEAVFAKNCNNDSNASEQVIVNEGRIRSTYQQVEAGRLSSKITTGLAQDNSTLNPSQLVIVNDESGSSESDHNLDISGDVLEENDILDEFFSNLHSGGKSKEIESELSDLMNKQRREMRDASDVNSLMMLETQELIKLFGLPYMESPAEAESQCAFLVEKNIADGIITDDSDIFLFGGTHVYRHFFNQQKYCELFKAEDLKQNMKLDRDRLIRFAYLVGSDYTVGLKGLGPVTSLEILREWDSYGIDGLIQFKEWAKEVQNLKPPGKDSGLKIRLRKAVAKLGIPESFPDQRVYEAYINPILDSNCEHFTFGLPMIDKLRKFMKGKVGWDELKTDQILIPVIAEMKKRSSSMVQTNITTFFPQSESSQQSHGSKRIQEIIKDWN